MKNVKQRITAVLAAAGIFISLIPYSYADSPATRGEAADMLLRAADDYNPSVKRTDIIKGYEDGLLHEDEGVSRVQALVMLKRAFGTLPKPTGHNKRVALKTEDFTDVPDWAKAELENVFDSGIVAGTGGGRFSPDDAVTKEQLELFIKRVFSLYGTNLKDDFYATVNKDTLESLEIPAGMSQAGGLTDVASNTLTELDGLIRQIPESDCVKGSKEQKIKALYDTITDVSARNAAGITPIQKYIDLINAAENINDLTEAQNLIYRELCVSPFMAFYPTPDAKDSSRYILDFEVYSPDMEKEFYQNSGKKQLYIDFVSDLLANVGETDSAAKAEAYYAFQSKLAKSELDVEDMYDVDKIYNVFTIREIDDMFPNADINRVFENSGMASCDKVVIRDLGLVKRFSEMYGDENLDALKTAAKVTVAASVGQTLTTDIQALLYNFNSEYTGSEQTLSADEVVSVTAVSAVENLLPEETGRFYAEKRFSKAAKDDIKEMVAEMISVYSDRIDELEWMSLETRTRAKRKLATMEAKIGYPDEWDEMPYNNDSCEMLSAGDGGSYFDNYLAIQKAYNEVSASLPGTEVDKDEWLMEPYEVNACYNAAANDITFPAAILQPPMYDVNASREENLGGIGYIIAHEITHAFDDSGAKFDENGNAGDWWRDSDREKFKALCAEVEDFYDGEEAIAGIGMNGKLTLSENIADMGAAACITEIASRMDKPDYKAMYEKAAKIWAVTETRELAEVLKNTDTHSDAKLRINRVFQTVDRFYTVYNIKEGDGMYVPPEERAKIW